MKLIFIILVLLASNSQAGAVTNMALGCEGDWLWPWYLQKCPKTPCQKSWRGCYSADDVKKIEECINKTHWEPYQNPPNSTYNLAIKQCSEPFKRIWRNNDR